MYDQVEKLPISENTQMRPVSPYTISKASAYWIVNSYKNSYDLFACNGILFNHESFLQRENFFVKKVINNAIKIKHGKLSNFQLGNLEVSRDFGYVPEYLKAMHLMLQQNKPVNYLICSSKSIKLRDIVYYFLDKVNIDWVVFIESEDIKRQNRILNIHGDNSEAIKETAWNYDLSFFDILDILIEQEELHLIN